MEWNTARLVVAVTSFGVFVSTNEGAGFAAADFRVLFDRDRPSAGTVVPIVEDLASDPADPNRLVAALNSHGCFLSTDGGLTWNDLYGDLSVVNPEATGAWVRSAKSVAVIVAGSPSTIVAGLLQDGLYRTTDGGATWTKVALEPGVQPVQTVRLQRFAIANVPGLPRRAGRVRGPARSAAKQRRRGRLDLRRHATGPEPCGCSCCRGQTRAI